MCWGIWEWGGHKAGAHGHRIGGFDAHEDEVGWCQITYRGDGEGYEVHGEWGEDCVGLHEFGVKMALSHADVMEKGLKHIGNGISLVLV